MIYSLCMFSLVMNYLSVCLSACLSCWLSGCLAVWLFGSLIKLSGFCLFVWLPTCLYASLFFFLTSFGHVCLINGLLVYFIYICLSLNTHTHLTSPNYTPILHPTRSYTLLLLHKGAGCRTCLHLEFYQWRQVAVIPHHWRVSQGRDGCCVGGSVLGSC